MSILSNLLYNLRLLRKSPVHVSMCIFVIGLGMGLSITGYSITSNFGPQTMPFPDGDKHVSIVGTDSTNNQFVRMDGYIYQTVQSLVQSYRTFSARREG